MTGWVLEREAVRVLAVAWMLVLIGGLVLFVGYRSIPEFVVLYRLPWADAPLVGPKSVLSVGRIVLMGVGQLGAATAMVLASRGSAPWGRFWRWLGFVAGVKTLLECVGFLMPQGSLAEQALTLATLAAVGLFMLRAALWWRRGELPDRPPLEGRARPLLFGFLALWAVSAIAPRLLA